VWAKPIDAEILGSGTLSSVEFWKSSLSHTGNVRDDVYATVAQPRALQFPARKLQCFDEFALISNNILVILAHLQKVDVLQR
jgi:hypothetical protein